MPLPGLPDFPLELERELETVRVAKGPSYVPRTHHLHADGRPRFTNRLIKETSPYLLQHAHNPVSWHPWGDEAFELAAREDRPVLLSVGYSTCHWCHVMERESFEDEEIATYINQHFVPIKVDREERPDVDDVYMAAVQLLSGHGGWPMTVVMSPDRRPFFGGTYYPARDGDRGARAGFLTVLERLVEVYGSQRGDVNESAERLLRALNQHAQPRPSAEAPGVEAFVSGAAFLMARFDPEHGGFGHAPKFPRPSTFELLLRYFRRSGDQQAKHVVLHSLDRMRRGGLYDQIAGGFHRYSTDERWLVPHFEKMLYDNAQLVSVYLDAYQVSAEPAFAATARDTLDYVLREMTSPEGGFYSATDADSEGEEGTFFVWTKAELETVLGAEDAEFAARVYGVTDKGSFEGKNILHLPVPLDEVAKSLSIARTELDKRLESVNGRLYAARKRREPPLLDDKILTEWNGQMIGSLARGGFVLNVPSYVVAAERAARFVLDNLRPQGRLLRAYREGRARHRAVLEDHVFLAAGLIDLFEASGDLRWLSEAKALTEEMLERFSDPEAGGFFGVAHDAEQMIVRDKPRYDGAQPSGNSVAAHVLLRLYAFTQNARYRDEALRIFRVMGDSLEDRAAEAPLLAGALEHHLDRPKEIVIVYGPKKAGELDAVLRAVYLPNRAIVRVAQDQVERYAELIPFVANKIAADGESTAYVCTEGVCEAPARSAELFRRQLEATHPLKLTPE